MLPEHIVDIDSFPKEMIHSFTAGGFTVKVTKELNHAVDLDEAHEMCINRDLKMAVVRPTQVYLIFFRPHRIESHKNMLNELFP